MSRRWAGTSRVGIVAAALALAAAWCPAALAATPDTVLSSCSFSALKSAVAALSSSPSVAQIAAVTSDASSVVSSVKNFTDATSSQCG